mmetsp:Transcript_26639/g.38594  ORF Transcript_26639/g.38594 Transcript_26639/m.38594 type:complete len:546 (-) Transcript_26639:699-2336(-)
MGKGGEATIGPLKKACDEAKQLNYAPEEKAQLPREPTRKITAALLSTKNTTSECWIAYEGSVYDITHWLSKHPGGMHCLMSSAGQDATSVMNSLHKPETLANNMRRIRRVGVLDQGDVTGRSPASVRAAAIAKDFAELNDKLVKEEWFTFKPSMYWAVLLRVTSFLVLGISFVIQGGGKWRLDGEDYSGLFVHDATSLLYLLLGSVLLGLFFQNIAFIGHDAGHFSITGSIAKDLYIGLVVGNTLTGIDLGWWKSTHNVHHSATNSVHDDPDIQHFPVLCFEERLSENRWSSYHGRFMPLLDELTARIVKYQHWYFYPVIFFGRFNLYIQSIKHVVETCPFVGKGGHGPNKNEGFKVTNTHTGETQTSYILHKGTRTQWSLQFITLGIFWYLNHSLLSRLDVVSAIICFFVTNITAGILHIQIILSHIGMNYCGAGSGSTEGKSLISGLEEEAGYYEWQALSTLDVDCPPWMDWAHGGLQFQLEHHLFPRLPRWSLRRLIPLTDAIFEKYGIPVVRKPFLEANYMVLMQMKRVGEAVSKRKMKQC